MWKYKFRINNYYLILDFSQLKDITCIDEKIKIDEVR